jgi:hypothetical protein
VNPDAPEHYGSSDDALALRISVKYGVSPRYMEWREDDFHMAYLEKLRREAKRLVNLNKQNIRDLGRVICGRLMTMTKDLIMSQEEVEKEIERSGKILRK